MKSAVSGSDELLTRSREAFLREVRRRVPGALREVQFDGVLDALIDWSAVPSRRLEAREPGDQHTVSFSTLETGTVLWAAYPRREDGAKVVVLPRSFRTLSTAGKRGLLTQLAEASPTVKITGTGLLQVPLHLLASDRALKGFLELLSTALRLLRPSAV